MRVANGLMPSIRGYLGIYVDDLLIAAGAETSNQMLKAAWDSRSTFRTFWIAMGSRGVNKHLRPKLKRVRIKILMPRRSELLRKSQEN